jgi:hypothetical protein
MNFPELVRQMLPNETVSKTHLLPFSTIHGKKDDLCISPKRLEEMFRQSSGRFRCLSNPEEWTVTTMTAKIGETSSCSIRVTTVWILLTRSHVDHLPFFRIHTFVLSFALSIISEAFSVIS